MTQAKLYLLTALLSVGGLGALPLCAVADTLAAASDNMPLGPPTLAPHGFLEFCANEPSACGLDPSSPAPEQALMRSQWERVFAASDRQPEASSVSAAPPPAALKPAPLQPADPSLVDDETASGAPAEIAAISVVPISVAADPLFAPPLIAPQPGLVAPHGPAPLTLETAIALEASVAADRFGDWRSDAPSAGLDFASGLKFPTTSGHRSIERLEHFPQYWARFADQTLPQVFEAEPLLSGLIDSIRSGRGLDAPSSSQDAAAVTGRARDPHAPVGETQTRLALLQEVNARINAAIVPARDREAFGAEDVWTLPLERGGRALGNCKHYALEKQQALLRAGVPAADLSLALVRVGDGEMHAILLVRTDGGEVVLDNLTGQIKPWREAPYIWLERQMPGHPLAWVSLAGAPGPKARRVQSRST